MEIPQSYNQGAEHWNIEEEERGARCGASPEGIEPSERSVAADKPLRLRHCPPPPRISPPLQLRQSESRVQGVELRERRRAFLEAERERKEEEAARRLQEVREAGG